MLVDESGRQFRLGIYGLALRANEVLLTRLSAVEAEAGAWVLPGGGLDWGEDPPAGLKREFLEETGLAPEVGDVLGLHSFVGRHRAEIHVIQVVYRVKVEGTLIHEIDGTTDLAQWWPLADLHQIQLVELVELALGWAAA